MCWVSAAEAEVGSAAREGSASKCRASRARLEAPGSPQELPPPGIVQSQLLSVSWLWAQPGPSMASYP